jgi:hypothetical protein
MIGPSAFKRCTQLTTVALGEGLEEIGWGAFNQCTSLREIVIPPRVRVIGGYAFARCTQLATVELGEGLEDIGEGAFEKCTSLLEIVIPSRVRVIRDGAFSDCTQLTSAVLGEGLEQIGRGAFIRCSSLQQIVIPRAVRSIHDEAFKDCSQLKRVVFCNEIQELVSAESMRDWWNQGLHKKSLRTFSFLVRCNITQRLNLLHLRNWQANIHEMLSNIPSITDVDMNAHHPNIYLRGIPTISNERLNAHFDSIDSKISFYEQILRDAPILLELAIWKSKITEPSVQNNDHSATEMRKRRRIDSVSNVTIIVPNVLSFL